MLPPDVNASNVEFTPVKEGIRFGLMGVRGVGRGVAEEIIAERERGGKFSSLHDFVTRLGSKVVQAQHAGIADSRAARLTAPATPAAR